ncbi:hypothetical protein ACWDE9_24940 [Streptomyces olivaceoviridis]
MTAGHEEARGAGRAGRAGRDGQHGERGGNGENNGEHGQHGEQRGNAENGEHGQHRRHGEQRGSGGYREHGDHREHGEYDGRDALMAAITGDPLPEEARRNPAFLAELRAAEADVAVLRDHLARLAEALTGEAGTEEAAEASPDAVSAVPPAPRPRGRTRPSAATRPAPPPPPPPGGGPTRGRAAPVEGAAGVLPVPSPFLTSAG